jgi:uncharacterized protein YndB with AHSA1/START domain
MTIKAVSGVSATVQAPPEALFTALSNGWSYPEWVVGASHVRAVDDDWPAKGTRIHHSMGAWPLLIEDSTEVLLVDPPRLLVLEARLWPLGKARVRFDLDGDGETTTITMTELATRGPIAMLPVPVQTRLIAPRNRESLRRLARLAKAEDETA